MKASEEAAFELYDEFSKADPDFASIFKDWLAFRNSIQEWHGLAETAYLNYVGQER